MRKEIYRAICAALQGIDGAPVKHVDLWNHNVEFIEQEEAWDRPAVFVEFAPIEWRGDKAGYHTNGMLRLHIVTGGEGFGALRLVGSDTNHNHEDIVESIEHFAYTGEWNV